MTKGKAAALRKKARGRRTRRKRANSRRFYHLKSRMKGPTTLEDTKQVALIRVKESSHKDSHRTMIGAGRLSCLQKMLASKPCCGGSSNVENAQVGRNLYACDSVRLGSYAGFQKKKQSLLWTGEEKRVIAGHLRHTRGGLSRQTLELAEVTR